MRPYHLILPILAGLFASVWFIHSPLSAPEASAVPAQQEQIQVLTMRGETVLTVPEAIQLASGIATTRLVYLPRPSAPVALLNVLDLQPLLELGARLAVSRAEREVALAQVEASQAQVTRMRLLYGDDQNVSQKALQDAVSMAKADQARFSIALTTSTMVSATIAQHFGMTLAQAAARPEGGLWRDFVTGRTSLVRIVIHDQKLTLPEKLTVIALDGSSHQGHKLTSAPNIDPWSQGATWLYTVTPALPQGARIRVPLAGEADSGSVRALDHAVVWYGEQRWIYVKTGPQQFTRRLMPEGLRVDDVIVTRGAALLLSEEQRPRGIATQCKDPPECDD